MFFCCQNFVQPVLINLWMDFLKFGDVIEIVMLQEGLCSWCYNWDPKVASSRLTGSTQENVLT